MSSIRTLLRALVLAVSALSCSGATVLVDHQAVLVQQVEQRLQGVWRLVSYIPDSALSPALLLGMQSAPIRVRFDHGHVSSETTALQFRRPYRITEVGENEFTLFILDPEGIEYETHARFRPSGEIEFRTVTAPWVGHGVLAREGAGLPPMTP